MGLALLWSKIKRLKFASSFTSPDFFFKKISVMKWLWSKKFINGPVTTTPEVLACTTISTENFDIRFGWICTRERWCKLHTYHPFQTENFQSSTEPDSRAQHYIPGEPRPSLREPTPLRFTNHPNFPKREVQINFPGCPQRHNGNSIRSGPRGRHRSCGCTREEWE